MKPDLVDYALLRFIPLAPLLAAVAIAYGLTLVRRPLPTPLVIALSCLATFVSLALSSIAFARLVFSPVAGDEIGRAHV